MNSLLGKTAFITGSSRGIGRSMALKLAANGANVIIAAKTELTHPKLSGTIYSVADEIREKNGNVFPVKLDVRSETNVVDAVNSAVKNFGGIDILVNNAGAIKLFSLEDISIKDYDLINSVNMRAAFLCVKSCLPYLKKSKNAHVINISPPINMKPEWFLGKTAYTVSKYAMSLYTFGLAAELRDFNISVNSLWPKFAIDTAATRWLLSNDAIKNCRKSDIMADALLEIVRNSPCDLTGKTLIDENVLRESGVIDFNKYACFPGNELLSDFYVD